jgi:Asp-tRNA(Asn)/Glu-tRNA(Gln) amidotransferase A subunit family amidase
MTELADLSACDALQLLRSRRISATELVRACLDRIATLEPIVGAWTHLAAEAALSTAALRDAAPPQGALHGLPIGVKDILDTADMPTTYGSPIYAGWRPRADACAVTVARRAGAVLLGKTVTTEFACGSLVRTANGLNFDHTSGGSSAGSSAAVAARMVPLALGTQSASSTIRPASYNGLVGMRPSMGLISVAGFKYFNASFDTIGLLARDVDDVELLWCSQLGAAFERGVLPRQPPSVLVCYPSWLDRAEPVARDAIDAAARLLAAAGASVTELALPVEYDRLVLLHEEIQAFEAARSYAWEYENHRDLLDRRVRALIERGMAVPPERYIAMLEEAAAARQTVPALIGNADAILTAAAPGEAPLGWRALGDAFDDLGDTTQSRAWTLLHLPVVTVPAILGAHGLPVGVQLIGRFGQDRALLHTARWAQAAIGQIRAVPPNAQAGARSSGGRS